MTDRDSVAEAMIAGGDPSEGSLSGQTDRDLVRRILSCGDQEAMGCLWQRHRREVERVIAGELRHARRVEVEDLAEEVWLTVFAPEKLAQWRAKTPSIRPWLRSIARNAANGYARRIRECLWGPDEDSGEPSGEPSSDRREDDPEDPEDVALTEISEARLLEAIDRCASGLTPPERMAFSCWLDGGSLTDLAWETGKKPNAVYQDLDRAKEKVFGKLLRHYRDILPDHLAGDAPRGKWRRG